MSLFLAADACLSWSLPSITEQQVSPHRLPMQYWLKNHRLSSNTLSTPTVFSNSAILRNNYISLLSDLCACVQMRKIGVGKEAIVLQWAVRIASCDFKPGKKRWGGALLSERCCCFVWKRRRRKKNILAVWRLSISVLCDAFKATAIKLYVSGHHPHQFWEIYRKIISILRMRNCAIAQY